MASTSSARAPTTARVSLRRDPRARASRRAAAAPRASRASPPPGLAFSSDADAIDPAEASAVAGRAGDAAHARGQLDVALRLRLGHLAVGRRYFFPDGSVPDGAALGSFPEISECPSG